MKLKYNHPKQSKLLLRRCCSVWHNLILQLSERHQLFGKRLRLVFLGRILNNHQIISHCGLADGSVVLCAVSEGPARTTTQQPVTIEFSVVF